MLKKKKKPLSLTLGPFKCVAIIKHFFLTNKQKMTTLYSVATIAMPFQAQYKSHQLHPTGDLHTHTHFILFF